MALFKRKAPKPASLSPMTGAPAVQLNDVHLSREGRVVFEGLDVSIDERRVGIVGDNGSGKSTLTRLLNGLLMPDSGQVHVYGHDVAEHASAMPSLVGFIFQNPDHQILFPTVLEELVFGLVQLGQSGEEAETVARQFLADHGASELTDRPAFSLSEGQKQRLCLWAVLLMQPSLLVLDETFASLDLRSRRNLMQELESQEQQLLMVTHELDLLEGFDRVLWLHDGKVREDGCAQSVLASYRQYAISGA